jgi:CubicO group peptidase (beta-lactamase class C family)
VRRDQFPYARPEELGFSAKRLDDVHAFYADMVKRGELPGAVILVARHGKIAHFSAVGYADVERRQRMRTDTIFRLYSMTKPIASTALMMLYEAGRFQLQEPVSKHIPEFANLKVLRDPDAGIEETVPLTRVPTIQDLMRHTAGLTHGGTESPVDRRYRDTGLFDLDGSLCDMITKLVNIPLAYQPNTKFAYSIGPDVQARLVEVLSGLPFDEFLQTRLFAPLGMRDTGFWLRPDKAARLSTVYWEKDGKLVPIDDGNGFPEKEGFLADPISVNSYHVDHPRKGGSYGLVGTAEDYWRYAQMMLNGGELDGIRVLSSTTVGFMTRDHLDGIDMYRVGGRPSGLGFGLGFAIIKDPAAAGYVSSEGSFSWGGAAGTQFWVDPHEDLVVVAMIQLMGSPTRDSFESQLHALVYGAMVK